MTLRNFDVLYNRLKCPTCHEISCNFKVAPCNHSFCAPCCRIICSHPLANKKVECPICREEFSRREMTDHGAKSELGRLVLRLKGALDNVKEMARRKAAGEVDLKPSRSMSNEDKSVRTRLEESPARSKPKNKMLNSRKRSWSPAIASVSKKVSSKNKGPKESRICEDSNLQATDSEKLNCNVVKDKSFCTPICFKEGSKVIEAKIMIDASTSTEEDTAIPVELIASTTTTNTDISTSTTTNMDASTTTTTNMDVSTTTTTNMDASTTTTTNMEEMPQSKDSVQKGSSTAGRTEASNGNCLNLTETINKSQEELSTGKGLGSNPNDITSWTVPAVFDIGEGDEIVLKWQKSGMTTVVDLQMHQDGESLKFQVPLCRIRQGSGKTVSVAVKSTNTRVRGTRTSLADKVYRKGKSTAPHTSSGMRHTVSAKRTSSIKQSKRDQTADSLLPKGFSLEDEYPDTAKETTNSTSSTNGGSSNVEYPKTVSKSCSTRDTYFEDKFHITRGESACKNARLTLGARKSFFSVDIHERSGSIETSALPHEKNVGGTCDEPDVIDLVNDDKTEKNPANDGDSGQQLDLLSNLLWDLGRNKQKYVFLRHFSMMNLPEPRYKTNE